MAKPSIKDFINISVKTRSTNETKRVKTSALETRPNPTSKKMYNL